MAENTASTAEPTDNAPDVMGESAPRQEFLALHQTPLFLACSI